MINFLVLCKLPIEWLCRAWLRFEATMAAFFLAFVVSALFVPIVICFNFVWKEKTRISLDNSFVAFLEKLCFGIFSAELAPLNSVFLSLFPKDVAIYTMHKVTSTHPLPICFCMQNMDVLLLLSFIHCLAHFKRETYRKWAIIKPKTSWKHKMGPFCIDDISDICIFPSKLEWLLFFFQELLFFFFLWSLEDWLNLHFYALQIHKSSTLRVFLSMLLYRDMQYLQKKIIIILKSMCQK